MTCYNPLFACYSKSNYAKTGKKDIHLVMRETYDENKKVIKDSKYMLNEKSFPHALYEYINLPCGKCEGCRSDNAKMWSLRAYHEFLESKESCFITLTYDDNSDLVQKDPLCTHNLRYKHFQNFIKRLRKEFPGKKFTYIVCGEYGPSDGRAHWHAILFGFDFPDKTLHHISKGFNHYDSEIFRRLWSTYNRDIDSFEPIGFVDLCDVDYDCCAYVAGYVLKKLDIGNVAPIVAHVYNSEVGKVEDVRLSVDGRCPPMIRSSKRPAIGLNWFKKYGKNVCERGFSMIPKGDKKLKVKTPTYYMKKFEEFEPEKFTILNEKREVKMRKYYAKNPVDMDKLTSWRESHLYRIKNKIKRVLTKFIV